MSYDGPVLDNHLHLDPESGRGLEAVRDFANAGGTHLLVVNKPSWHHGIEVEVPADFHPVFERTVATVRDAADLLPGTAWPVLGVHPGLISRLVDERGFEVEDARELMAGGLEVAAEVAADGPPVALKSGRPHYDVTDAVWDASNAVTRRAFELGAETGVAVQLHTEASEDLTELAEWAEDAGLTRGRVVKHYASGTLAGPVPSVMCERDWLETAAERAERAAANDRSEPFLMETDFIDDPDRPGAVMGPRTVPRRVEWLAESGHDAALEIAHVGTPKSVYGVDTRDTLGPREKGI